MQRESLQTGQQFPLLRVLISNSSRRAYVEHLVTEVGAFNLLVIEIFSQRENSIAVSSALSVNYPEIKTCLFLPLNAYTYLFSNVSDARKMRLKRTNLIILIKNESEILDTVQTSTYSLELLFGELL